VVKVKISPEKNFNIKKMLLWAVFWIGSIILFDLICISKFGSTNLEYSPIETAALLFVVGFGIISFIIFAYNFEKLIKYKYSGATGSLISAVSIVASLVLGIALLFTILNVHWQQNSKEVQAENTKYTLLQTPLRLGSTGNDVKILQAALKQNKNVYPSGIVSGYYGQMTADAVNNFQKNNSLPQTGEMDKATIDKFNEIYGSQSREYYLSSSPTSPQANFNPPVQNTVQTNVDSDPIVNCLIHEKCGGGSMRIKKSQCDNTICCFYPDRNVFYMDKNQCNSSNSNSNNQQNTNTNQQPQNSNSNRVPVFLTYGGYTRTCPSQNISAIQSIDATMNSKRNEWATSFNQCADNFRNNDSCYQSCKTSHTNTFMACSDSACYDQASSAYGTCISGCPDVNKACESVYWEQKSLTNQINNLCQ
jgi:peptidoglycan hydrolase-like protein with peptidoglycan-binding domain